MRLCHGTATVSHCGAKNECRKPRLLLLCVSCVAKAALRAVCYAQSAPRPGVSDMSALAQRFITLKDSLGDSLPTIDAGNVRVACLDASLRMNDCANLTGQNSKRVGAGCK